MPPGLQGDEGKRIIGYSTNRVDAIRKAEQIDCVQRIQIPFVSHERTDRTNQQNAGLLPVCVQPHAGIQVRMGWQSGSEGSYLLPQQPDMRKLWISKQRGQRPQRKTLDLPHVRMHP